MTEEKIRALIREAATEYREAAARMDVLVDEMRALASKKWCAEKAHGALRAILRERHGQDLLLSNREEWLS